MKEQRVRVVKGSCWPCKKRRVKCDLGKPACRRCFESGTSCDYNTCLIRWSNRPNAKMWIVPKSKDTEYDLKLSTRLVNQEERALTYFHVRVWPLLSTAPNPCSPPSPMIFEHRIILLATCVFATTHRYLQEGQGEELITPARSDCLVALRLQIEECSEQGSDMVQNLLLAVLLLYLHDGLVEGSEESATATHHSGVIAILKQLGGMMSVLGKCHDSISMLLSEFASADLTTALLNQSRPAFSHEIWDSIDLGPVWWGRDPLRRCSLAAVFREMAAMAEYTELLHAGVEELSTSKIRQFEATLQSVIVDSTITDIDHFNFETLSPGQGDIEAEQALTLVRTFQQTALVILYRSVCGLPPEHALVQQHVNTCLDILSGVRSTSSILHCIIFPLYVCGAHASTMKRRVAVKSLVDLIFDSMRFASVREIGTALQRIWQSGKQNSTWADMFAHLSSAAVVL